MSGVDLWQEIQDTKRLLDIALKEAKNEHSELYDEWIANVDKAISD